MKFTITFSDLSADETARILAAAQGSAAVAEPRPQVEVATAKSKAIPPEEQPVKAHPVPKAKAAPKPKAASTKEPAAEASEADVREALKSVLTANGMPAAQELLGKFDARRVSDLKAEQYAAFVAAAKAATA